MSPRHLRIATLNCLNLALPARTFYAGVAPYSTDEYLAKTQWLANMVDRLAADFVLVQEVFHADALSDVVRQTAAGPSAYHCAAPLASQQNDKPRLGVIWRTPWQPQIDSIAQLPAGCAVAIPEQPDHTVFSRPLLRLRVPLRVGTAAELTLLNVHLKSRRPEYVQGEAADDPAAAARAQLRVLIKRGAEAAALRRIVSDALAAEGAMLVVAGDFNDEANAVTTRIVADSSWRHEGAPPPACALFNALAVAEEGTRAVRPFTILHAGEPEAIDHVFVSDAFAGADSARGCVTSVEVLGDHLIERRRRTSESVYVGADLARIYSDHAAVCATLELKGD
ncbi:MAG TPA: endonuclease/exonuclease/phosphatase family protein [Burkholderiaceae bacterium]|nr:endonuclease/exonuclease/phosphatase family protein [Burkholderiaceae bacterium]